MNQTLKKSLWISATLAIATVVVADVEGGIFRRRRGWYGGNSGYNTNYSTSGNYSAGAGMLGASANAGVNTPAGSYGAGVTAPGAGVAAPGVNVTAPGVGVNAGASPAGIGAHIAAPGVGVNVDANRDGTARTADGRPASRAARR